MTVHNSLLLALAGLSFLPFAGVRAGIDWQVRSWDCGARLNTVDFIRFEPNGPLHIIAGGANGVWLATPGEPEPRRILDTIDGRIMHGVAADANGDGLRDFFIGRFSAPWVDHRNALAAGEESPPPRGPDFSLAWLENPGDPAGEWTLHPVDNELNQTHGTLAADLNGDGRPDFVANTISRSEWDRSILWYPGPLEGGANSRRNSITQGGAGGRPHYFAALDLDGDGRLEVLMTDNNTLRAWSSGPDRENWTSETLATKRGLTNVAIADINGDGREDIVYSCGHGSGIHALVAPEFSEAAEWTVDPAITDAHALAAGDFNGDGLADVAGISFTESIAVWYENAGGGEFVRHLIDLPGPQQAYDLRAVDIDRDGRLDLIAAGRNSRNILWLRNAGVPESALSELPEEVLARFPEERPSDAVAFQSSYYKVFKDEDGELSWHQKKALCERMGGHLAVIETAEEQSFIAELADEEYLSLGGTDEAEEGVWRWVNGAPWDLTFWEEGQPNNYGGDEHYLATFYDGLWVDVTAAGLEWWMPVGFICEWPEESSFSARK